ncbi:MAG: drug/metabolite transporter (DMT)-like permease [Pseudomonadales bacterium]|jgi:drug/metabolite transporter (DMT)-like permease
MHEINNNYNPVSAVTWMMGALVSFSTIAICARELSGVVPIYHTLLVRSVIGLICITLIIVLKQRRDLFSTTKIRLHSGRNIFHFAGQYTWFWGISLLPLAEVFALEFTVPIWTAIIAAIFLDEKITGRKVLSIVLGLCGVLIIVKPGYGIVEAGAFIVLASALLFSVSHTTSKVLSRTENSLTILFYMCLIQLPIGLILAISDWTWPQLNDWPWLLLVSLSALSARFCLTRAMQYADVTTIVTLDFLRLPLIALVGVLLYQEQFELSLIIGGLIMLSANLVGARR